MSTIVITGGSRGTGAAAVARFAARGDRVYFLYEKNYCFKGSEGMKISAINMALETNRDLFINNADKQYFKDLTQGNESNATRESHKRISRALGKLKKFVNSIVNNAHSVEDKIDALTKIEDIIHNNCIFCK